MEEREEDRRCCEVGRDRDWDWGGVRETAEDDGEADEDETDEGGVRMPVSEGEDRPSASRSGDLDWGLDVDPEEDGRGGTRERASLSQP